MNRIIVLSVLFTFAHCASISNEIVRAPTSGEELISAIINDCIEIDGMSCMKGKVLSYLDTVLGLRSEQARAFDSKNVDKVIYDRVSRILASNEIRVELPKVIFGDVTASYRPDRGVEFTVSQKPEAARGLLKKKLLFPVLLLLKLKMKALMPIVVALIGLKAMKALILSKLAITIVLGFLIAQLVKKTGLGMMPMSMMPMMPAEQVTTPATPDSSYGPAAWEPSSASASYNIRTWEPSSAASSHNLAYSSYYPSSSGSSSYSQTASSSSVSSPSSPGSSSSNSVTAQAY